MKWLAIIIIAILFIPVVSNERITIKDKNENNAVNFKDDIYGIQWEHSYGRLPWWSARYEGPQPIGDADNDGKNELLIGGRDPFLRVMKWNGNTYIEQAKIIDPVFGIGYSFMGIPEPFGSATGFAIGDLDNDGKNEIGVAWGHHFSAFKWDGNEYKKIGMYAVSKRGTTLDCIIGDADNDGKNEVVITGGYGENTPEVLVIKWNGEKFVKESEWNAPGQHWVYFPWIADVDNDGKNEIICNTNQTIVLKWHNNRWNARVIASYNDTYPFGCVSKDSDNDGMPEIHVTFWTPELRIFKYENGSYIEKAHFYWKGEEGTIEAIDVGDVDNDGVPEVAVGTNYIHIIQWNGTGYEEEHVIKDTHGLLAITCIGDTDNDGKNEINAGSVGKTSLSEDYEEWIFKYGWK